MHYFRAPFALLATTFAITVLATPLNGPARVPPRNITGNVTPEVTDLFMSLGLANQAVQIVNNNIKSVNSKETEPEPETMLNDFSTAIDHVNQTASLVQAAGTLDDQDGQNLMRLDIIPLFDSLNATAGLSGQQAQNISNSFSFSSFFSFRSLLGDMSSAKSNLEEAIRAKFAPDTVELLNTISTDVDISFNATISLPIFQPIG